MIKLRFLAVLFVFVAVGCTEVERQRSPITPTADRVETILRITDSFSDDTGRPTVFANGSRWVLMGQVREGTVMRPVDGGLNVTGINSREGYAVVSADRLVGYWLPNEEAFSPASGKIQLKFVPME